MKGFLKSILILTIILCFAIPAFAVKILPYNMPLHDIMSWDQNSATLKITNPEGESVSVAWASTVDLWNYDGVTWTFDLPTGNTFAFGKGVSVTGDLTVVGKTKIHSHSLASGVEYANEFKGEFLSATGIMDGIAAHYHLGISSTGVLRAMLGVAYLDSGFTLSGTSASASWISGILGSVNIAGVIDGTAVTVTGVYGGLGSMTGGTLTECKYMSAIWADSQVTQVPSAGESQLFLMTNGLGATLDQAIYISGSDRITEFIHFVDVDTMVTAGSTQNAAVTCDAKIAITIDALGTFYIPVYAGTITLD